MQKPHRPVRACKLPHFMHRRIRQTVEILRNSGLPIAMVPCLHQRIAHIKRKLRVWRAQKCNFLISTKAATTTTGLQTTPFHASPYKTDSGKSGLRLAMVLCLHQRIAYIKRKLRVWRAKKCVALVCRKTPPTCAGLQTTLFHVWRYGAENGNMLNFVPTNPHCTAFAPKQCLYQKETTGMESPKMYCSSPWKNPTYLCGSANYPISWVAVWGREWKYAKLRAYQSPLYRVCTKAMFISKGSYGYGEPKNVLL